MVVVSSAVAGGAATVVGTAGEVVEATPASVDGAVVAGAASLLQDETPKPTQSMQPATL